MTPLPFTWPYALAFWAVFIWAFSPEYGIVRAAKEPAMKAGSPDAGSYRVITRVMGITTFIAFPLAWVHALQWPRAAQLVVFVLGIGLLIGGSLLRRHCFRLLGASFTGDVRAHPGQTIVQTGAYALVRHPSYTAGIIMNIGIGLALGSWASTTVLAIASFAVYRYRIAIEERALLAAVGEPYRDFMNTRRKLIPFFY